MFFGRGGGGGGEGGGGGGGGRRGSVLDRVLPKMARRVGLHVLHPLMKLDAFIINKQKIETKFSCSFQHAYTL